MPYSPYTVAEVKVTEESVQLSDGVSLKIIDFTPPDYIFGKTVVVFVAGWISLISGRQSVLKKLTPRLRTIYVETREKASARISDEKSVDFTMARMTADIHELLQKKIPENQPFYFVGSSLGSTVILDYLSQSLRRSRPAIVIGAEADTLHGIDIMEKMVTLMPKARLRIMAGNKETHSEKAGEMMVSEIIHCDQQEM